MNTLSATPLRFRAGVAVLASVMAAALVAVPAVAAHADEGDVTWTVRTASNDLGPDRTSFRYTLEPGTEVEDAMVVSNHGDTALDLGVYAADGFTTESGQFDLIVGGAESKNIGVWVQADSDRITIDPGATVEVPFIVSIPENATPGDYAGGIVTSLAETGGTETIDVDRRLGIRIGVRVGGDLAPSLAVENVHVDWNGGLNPFAGGDATVGYTLHNTGNTTLSAEQHATLTGPFGWFPSTVGAIADPPQLLPGESWTVSVPVRDVPATFLLSASVGVVPVVVEASGSTTSLERVEVGASGAAVPWMLLVLIVLVAALVVAVIRLRAVLTARRQAREDARVQEAIDLALAERAPAV